MFDRKKPTVQLLGRWQPWHDGHQELFKRALQKTGQVIIQVRDVQGVSAGMGHDDNPFDWDQVCNNISEGLAKDGYREEAVAALIQAWVSNSIAKPDNLKMGGVDESVWLQEAGRQIDMSLGAGGVGGGDEEGFIKGIVG